VIPEIGHYSLILALCLALVQATVPFVGAQRQNISYMQLAKFTARGQLFFVGTAFLALAYSFLVNDFSVAYVADNSNSHLPAIYRFCAVWGAHEGSLLLWVFMLTVWMTAVSIFSKSLPLKIVAQVLAVLSLIAIGFYLFLLVTSDPFVRSLPNFPIDGRDLNPILQDPGLVIHPPMLYMGYVGFSVAFAFAMTALINGQLDATWARWTRPWTQVAWCFLTYGIILGSWWAYRELGWGGWWFWDPVENASFLPWLIGTALIHSLAVAEKRNIFKAWTVLLAVCAFSLSLLGTFLVRSGVLISVHAFASDPTRGLYLLRFLMLVVGSSLALYAWRGRTIVNTGHFDFWSRETMLMSNNVILFAAMVTVLLGTLYPLVMGTLNLGTLSVGAPYFNAVFIPLMLPMLVLMGIGPLFHWNKMEWQLINRRLAVALIFVLAATSLLFWFSGAEFKWTVFVGVALALWVICNNVSLLKRRMSLSQLAMIVAHVGIGVTAIGLVCTTAYTQQRNLSMRVGDIATINQYQFQLSNLVKKEGPNYTAIEASVIVSEDNKVLTVLHPELRNYPVQQMTIGKTAITVGIFRDLYVAMGNALSDDAWSVRIYYKPFVRWIWGGGFLMILGGLLALFDRRYRQC